MRSKKITFNNAATRFNIPGDKILFTKIVSDMLKNGGGLAPSDHWSFGLDKQVIENEQNFDELFDKQYSNLQMMLDPWIGITGMQLLNVTIIEKYENFLRKIDHLKLLADNLMVQVESGQWRETDLGTIMDINLLTAIPVVGFDKKITVCEVGGGYGRLAEIFLMDLWNSVHYVLIDAVPGSLMYAYLYLKAQFPEKKIGYYYNGDEYNESFDCYIMPSWGSHVLKDSRFDISINIESLQEMSQYHVDYYLSFFDRITKSDSLIYISNARDYVFKGNWSIPKHWDIFFLHNTPRSWTPNHPTCIYRKGNGDYSLEQKIKESLFEQEVVVQQRLLAELQLKDHKIQDQAIWLDESYRICEELKSELVKAQTPFYRRVMKSVIKRLTSVKWFSEKNTE